MKNKIIWIGILILLIIFVVAINLYLLTNKEEIPVEKYYDWTVRFEIYDNPTGRYIFLSDEEFELTKEKILMLVGSDEYDPNSYTLFYEGIDTWTRFDEDVGKKRGFSINVTQKGYENSLSIMEVEHLQSGYYNRIINQEEQKEPSDEKEIYLCEEDRECVQVGTNCCANANCGFTSINVDYLNYWNSQFNCSGVACIAVVCDKSFYKECINNKCELVSNN